jgi:hypothetical protein
MSTTLDHNRTVFSGNVDALIDPDLIAIDQELLDGRTAAAVSTKWEAWNTAYAALQEALDADAPYLASRLRALGDAAGDLSAASDAAGFARGVALERAVRPPRTNQGEFSAFERFEMVPLGTADAA